MESKDRFKAVREHYKLSMAAFGEKIGLSASGVSAIEYGTRAMNEKHIKLIHAAFPEISEDWLRTGSSEMLLAPKKSSIEELSEKYNLSSLERDTIQAILELDDDQQKALLIMAKTLLKK